MSDYNVYRELLKKAKEPKQDEGLYNFREPGKDPVEETIKEVPKKGDFNDPDTWGILEE